VENEEGKTELLLLRHGETEENVHHVLQGTMPGHLTERGRGQVRDAAHRVASFALNAIVASDLQRCRDTVEILCAELALLNAAMSPSVLYTSLLRERDWGSATGMIVDASHRITIPADAETSAALMLRAQVFLRFVRETYGGRRVLVVSHGLILRFIQAAHRGVDIAEVERMSNCEIRTLLL